ncbi:MAG: efflux transporter outer membrane subunit [Syntrophorhabdaceae bacterium]|nr:efflux transporter outer membrane subunit [Syntrophorhabdaceae bacterium]
MYRKLLFLSLIALLAAGCAIGPDYKRPVIDVPHAYRYGDEKGKPDAADSEWWKQFNDPVLDQFIAEALLNNKNVKIAAANVARAAGSLMTTRSAFFPQITYNGTAERTQVSKNSLTVPTQNPYNNYQALGGASWEIDLWGRIRRLTESARASLYATMEARRGIVLSLTAEVASSYIQLRALDEQLVIARDTLRTYQESVRIFELQNKYGQVSGMTVQQARSQYETAASQIPQIEVQIAQTENALCILLGRNPGPVQRGLGLSELKMPPVPAGLPSELLERRPDVLQAEQNLIAANAQIGAAKALFFPRISLTGNAGWTSQDLSSLFIGPSAAWNYVGTVTGPIFTGGGILGQFRQAEAQQQAALYAYQQAIQNAFADTENALISRRKVHEQLVAEQKKVAAYKEYARLAGLQYNGGYTPYLTVLNAQQQLFPAQLSAIQTNASAFISIVNLYKAMGGGWVAKAEELTKGPGSPEEK